MPQTLGHHMMRMTKLRLVVLVALMGAAAAWWFLRADTGEQAGYRFATVERASIEATVSATGTLNAVTTVQVGTQVSGLVTEIHTDFNQSVKKGQLLARIDPTLLEQTVRDAEASLERNTAEVVQAQSDFARSEELFDRTVLTQAEVDAATYRLAVAKANMKSAQVGLDRAQRNLSYASIYAPIDGVVIERNVDVGQTVAASLSAPQLFLIANDLTQMEILASVDESDIGAIHEGQDVRFTVQPYPNEEFVGGGAAGAAAERDRGERRHLHRGRLGDEQQRAPAAGDDRDGGLHHRQRRQCPRRPELGAALPAHRRAAGGAHSGGTRRTARQQPQRGRGRTRWRWP